MKKFNFTNLYNKHCFVRTKLKCYFNVILKEYDPDTNSALLMTDDNKLIKANDLIEISDWKSI